MKISENIRLRNIQLVRVEMKASLLLLVLLPFVNGQASVEGRFPGAAVVEKELELEDSLFSSGYEGDDDGSSGAGPPPTPPSDSGGALPCDGR